MTGALDLDLKKLKTRAFGMAEWAEDSLRRYHAASPNLNKSAGQQLRTLYNWMFVPITLWPFNTVNARRRGDVFRAAFDAFCLRWNLYGMQNDEPLLLKLAVNITPYGTMIHIPAYWSFDPKRDIRWDAIARLHRARVPGRQGSALAENLADRMKAAEKLPHLDSEARRLGLKGDEKHEFICRGLGWDPRTSPKRLSRLRAAFSSTLLRFQSLFLLAPRVAFCRRLTLFMPPHEVGNNFFLFSPPPGKVKRQQFHYISRA